MALAVAQLALNLVTECLRSIWLYSLWLTRSQRILQKMHWHFQRNSSSNAPRAFQSEINKYAHSTSLIIICSNARLLTVCMLMQTRGNYCLFDLIVCPSYASIPVVWSMSDRHCEIELQQSPVVTTLWHATGSTATSPLGTFYSRAYLWSIIHISN
jgi:hypothetical protein